MDDEFQAMEIEDDLPEFTLAEIIEMEKLFKDMREKKISEKFSREVSAKFNRSTYRLERSTIKWKQVQSWFRDKQTNFTANVIPFSPHKGTVDSKTALIKKRDKGERTERKKEKSLSKASQQEKSLVSTTRPPILPTISASEAAIQLQNLMFEAQSAKDYAWFDVASFLGYRVLTSGELLVRVRFAGFGNEEDEWVSVKRAVRDRSIPLEHSECDKVNVGDLVLCFREGDDHALYCDAHVVEIERQAHDSSCCTCVFVVCFDHDNTEDKVTIDKLCCRPTKLVSKDSEDCTIMQLENGIEKVTSLMERSQLS